MDKASEYESGDSRFESWQGRDILCHTKIDFIPNIYCHNYLRQSRCLCGPMYKASDYESGDSRYESWQRRNILSHTKIDIILNIYCHDCLLQIRSLVAQWIRHLTTNQGIPGSSLGKVVIFCLILS